MVRFTVVRVTPRIIAVSLVTLLLVWTLQVWLAVSQHKRELLNPRGPLYALLVGIPTAIVAGPLYGEEGMLVVDCDLRQGLRAKYGFDAIGHYSREELLLRVLGSGDQRGEPASDLSGAFPPLHAGH